MHTPKVDYHLDTEGRFVIDEYNWAKAFSNFFPGIAGTWGVPLWAYYVSRGQAVASVGYRDKNGQILEFQSFNKAATAVPVEGFRTFLRLDGGELHEPFRRTRDPEVRQQMAIWPGELRLTETHERLGLEIRVDYFPLVNLRVGGLVRVVRVRDLTGRARRLEWADGAARILPSGMTQQHVKFVARHIEAMMGGTQVEGFPLFRLKQSAADVERIEHVTGGNYYLAFADGKAVPDAVVVDPDVLFGEAVDLQWPWVFESEGSETLKRPQMRECRTPCAFTVREQTLPANGETTLVSVLGHVDADADLAWLQTTLARPGFLEENRAEGRRVLDAIMDRSFTVSAEPVFDAYCRQNFLDNVMRGGRPELFDTAAGPSAFYTFSRQNGDLERDYHFFVLEPGWLSQGTGHYRSVLQNRSKDGWFFPEVGDANLVTFLNLMQLDGYNPLEVNGMSYRLAEGGEAELQRLVAAHVPSETARPKLLAMARAGFTPGAFLMALDRAAGGLAGDRRAIAQAVLALSVEQEVGGLHEGFWVDHWTYTLDLLDTYLAVWPDRLRELLLGREDYRFFDDPDVILPRDLKTVRVDTGVRRYGGVRRDQEKLARIEARSRAPYAVRTRHGEGEIYRTNALVKWLVLLANRLATLDPSGLGVDMEADKPGWNDSLNGLPGLFGSAVNETLELLRLARFLEDAVGKLDRAGRGSVRIFEELATLLEGLATAADARLEGGDAQAFWEQSNELKETYRASTRLGVTGTEREVPLAEVAGFAGKARRLLEAIFTRRDELRDASGVPYTYFIHRVTEAEETGATSHQGLPLVRAKAFARRPVRRFLEGPVHWLKVRPEEAREVYEAVRASPLFDTKLQMYKSCEDMTGEDPELGRAVGAYPRGWIENESIYLHMEYKYLLEVLRSGLDDAFFRDMRTALVPFQPPARYGRSILEGASFVVSSAFADPKLHGQAFQPRLSGITSEFIQMWTVMVAGEHPFRLGDDGALELALAPHLADWLFTHQPTTRGLVTADGSEAVVTVPANAFAFMLLGATLVVYENPDRRATYGERGARPVRYAIAWRDGGREEIEGACVTGGAAARVRAGEAGRIEVRLK